MRRCHEALGASIGENRLRMYRMRTILEAKLRTRAHLPSTHPWLSYSTTEALLLRSVMTSIGSIDGNIWPKQQKVALKIEKKIKCYIKILF